MNQTYPLLTLTDKYTLKKITEYVIYQNQIDQIKSNFKKLMIELKELFYCCTDFDVEGRRLPHIEGVDIDGIIHVFDLPSKIVNKYYFNTIRLECLCNLNKELVQVKIGNYDILFQNNTCKKPVYKFIK